MSTKSSKKSPDLRINVDHLSQSVNNFDSTFRAEGISVNLSCIRIDGQHLDMEVRLSDLIVEGKIGEGACSTVRRAIHRTTGVMYAVKMFNIYNKSQRSQLFNEVHMLKDVQCEALVSFCGAFFTDGSVGVILDYMDKGSLDAIISSPIKLSESAMGGIIFQVLWGLAYLHHDKNVHRDVKPGNTLLNSDGHVKLSDFGISRQLDGTTEMSNTYVGTFRFMSPERLLGDGYNSKGDVWSVGVMMLELWTKTCPFKLHLSSPLKLLEEIENTADILEGAMFPAGLESFIRQTLRIHPEDRPSAGELLQSPLFKNLGIKNLRDARRCVNDWLVEEDSKMCVVGEIGSDYSDDFEESSGDISMKICRDETSRRRK